MKQIVTFGQDHMHIIDGIILNKDCLAIIEGDKQKVKDMFGQKYSNCYLDANFDGNNLQFYPNGFIDVPDEPIIMATIDPLDKFNHYSQSEIYNNLGTLLSWVLNGNYCKKPLKEALNDQYGFGLFEMTGGTITKDGVHQYPEDQDLYPLIKIKRLNETFYQYLYAIVAIVQEDRSSFIIRMD